MNRFAVIGGTLALTAGLFAVPAAAVVLTDGEDNNGGGQTKVTICHVAASGQESTLELPENQANGHITGTQGEHGTGPVKDYLGPCTTTPEPNPTVTVYVEVPGPTVTVTAAPEPAPTVTVTATATVTAVPEPAPTVTVTAEPVPAVTVTATPEAVPDAPVGVGVPESPTVPNEVPAGDGSSQVDSFNPWLVLLGATAAIALAWAAVIWAFNRVK